MHIPLNLPILPQLENCQNILIAGAGGGFDVFVGLPIYYQLKQMGKTVHLANYSFADTKLAARYSDCDVLIPELIVGTRGNLKTRLNYFPEAYLAQYFYNIRGESVTVWMIQKEGVPRVKLAYDALVKLLNIDAIILVDGGVDSLMRGDETGAGTYLEDTISVTAVAMLDTVKVKLLAAIGIGTEVEENLNHHAMLENVAALAKENAYFGSCALIPQMPAFQFYEQAARYVFETANHETSRIQTRLIPSVWGEFGDYNWYNHPRQPPVFLSPLMSLYWFFDAVKVNNHSLIAPVIRTETQLHEAITASLNLQRGMVTRRQKRDLPL